MEGSGAPPEGPRDDYPRAHGRHISTHVSLCDLTQFVHLPGDTGPRVWQAGTRKAANCHV